MLLNPITHKLHQLRLNAMATAFKEQLEQPTMTHTLKL